MSKQSAVVKSVLALGMVFTAALPTLVRAQTNQAPLPLKASQLMGLKVEDTDGQKVGTVRNLVLDTGKGQLRYVVVASGGLLGVRATLKVAPGQFMSAATTKRDTLSVNATTACWNRAFTFKPAALASLAEPERAEQIASFFAQPDIRLADTTQHSLAATGNKTGRATNSPPTTLKFATDLIGMRVVNGKQEKIGEVLDLLVAFGQPHPAFAVISTGRLFHRGDQYAVPLSALRPDAKGKTLVMDADISTLPQAPLFNQRTWQAAENGGGPRIYRYSKTDE
jgi:sporulation protein YlmC with PRC-barrel domain